VSTVYPFEDIVIRGAEIADALTAATRAWDLADAFAWFKEVCQEDRDEQLKQNISTHSTMVHGATTRHTRVPAPSRALNSEVAYTIIDGLLNFDVRMTGLRSAAYLNVREVVIRGEDAARSRRWNAQLDDGTCVGMKTENFVHIRGEDYKRRSPPWGACYGGRVSNTCV
jgi:hypothetical protein